MNCISYFPAPQKQYQINQSSSFNKKMNKKCYKLFRNISKKWKKGYDWLRLWCRKVTRVTKYLNHKFPKINPHTLTNIFQNHKEVIIIYQKSSLT